MILFCLQKELSSATPWWLYSLDLDTLWYEFPLQLLSWVTFREFLTLAKSLFICKTITPTVVEMTAIQQKLSPQHPFHCIWSGWEACSQAGAAFLSSICNWVGPMWLVLTYHELKWWFHYWTEVPMKEVCIHALSSTCWFPHPNPDSQVTLEAWWGRWRGFYYLGFLNHCVEQSPSFPHCQNGYLCWTIMWAPNKFQLC
jgi:hypothetical protein